MRGASLDLVLIAVPAAVTPPAEPPSEEAIRSHSWILNWSLSFGRQEWAGQAAVRDSLHRAVSTRKLFQGRVVHAGQYRDATAEDCFSGEGLGAGRLAIP